MWNSRGVGREPELLAVLKSDEAFAETAERLQQALAQADLAFLQTAITHGDVQDVADALGRSRSARPSTFS